MSGRCPHCGRTGNTWTPSRIIDAIREWTATHGRGPSSKDWNAGGHGYPSIKTVLLHFPNIGAAREAAGVEFRPMRAVHRLPGEWTRQEIIGAIFQWRVDRGRLPSTADWRVPPDPEWPSSYAVRTVFGSWNAAIVAAGYEPRQYRAPAERRSKRAYRAQAAAATMRARRETA